MKTEAVRLLALTTLLAEEAPADGPAQVPDWVRIIPAGRTETTKGLLVLDEGSWPQILRHMERRGVDIVVDYEHNSTVEGAEAPAAGWIRNPDGLEMRDGELWGKVDWTPRARKHIEDREYRYLSPLVTIELSSRRAVALKSVGLTNTPAINNQLALAASERDNDPHHEPEDPMKDLRTTMIALLALSDTATDEEVTTAVTGLQTRAKALDSMGRALGVEVAEPAKLVEAALSLKAGHVDRTEFEALKLKLDKHEAGKLVETALSEGKVQPAQRKWAEDLALKDRDLFSQWLETAPVVVPVGDRQRQPASSAAGSGAEHSEVALSAARQLGVTPEMLKASQPA